MLGQERRVQLGPNFRPQMNTLFPGHVGGMLCLCWAMLGLCWAMLGHVGPRTACSSGASR